VKGTFRSPVAHSESSTLPQSATVADWGMWRNCLRFQHLESASVSVHYSVAGNVNGPAHEAGGAQSRRTSSGVFAVSRALRIAANFSSS